MQPKKPLGPLLIGALALTLAGCGPSTPVTVAGLSDVLGQSLPGAQGLNVEDQDKIDETVARGCRTRVFEPAKCALHTRASATRRQAIKGGGGLVS